MSINYFYNKQGKNYFENYLTDFSKPILKTHILLANVDGLLELREFASLIIEDTTLQKEPKEENRTNKVLVSKLSVS